MTETISLSENDYLDFQLYAASKSKVIKWRLLGSRVLTVALFVSASIVFYGKNNLLSYILLGLAMVSAVFFPLYGKWRYKNYILKYVRKTYKNVIDHIFNIDFKDNYLFVNDDSGDSKIKISEICEINETNKYFFIQLKNNQSLIIPKIQLHNQQLFADVLNSISNQIGVKIHRDLDWKWK